MLAVAGLKRLGFGDRIRDLIDPADSLPAPGQGALGLECRADRPEMLAALAPLADTATTLATTAERAFSRALSGSCRTPLAAYASWQEGTLWLRGLLASQDGRDVLRGESAEPVADAALSAHVTLAEGVQWPVTLASAQVLLAREFGIDHVTLQPTWPAPRRDGSVVVPIVERRGSDAHP